MNDSPNNPNNQLIERPLVSIGMPIYNGEKYLRRALDSLLSQQYDNFEIIISDNGSTDSTAEICKKYASLDPRIKVKVNELNAGSFINFLIVLKKSSGKYFMFAADDDFWAPQFLNTVVNELELHPECAVSQSALERINEDGSKCDTIRFFENENLNNISQIKLVFRAVTTENVCYWIYGLYRTEYIKSIFNEKIPQVFGSDLIFITHVFMTCRVRYVDKVLLSIQLHKEHTSERYSDENIGKLYGDRFRYIKMAAQLGPHLSRSSIIPTRNKTWIPILVGKQMIWAITRDFGIFRIPNRLLIRLKNFFRKYYDSALR